LDSQLTYYSVGLSQGFKLSWGFQPYLIALFSQRQAYHSIDDLTFQFDRVLTPYLGIGLRSTLVDSRFFDFSIDGTLLRSFAVKTPEYDTQSGLDFRLGVSADY
jgi:hypothetical protein